ncbi:MAG: sulfotransferase [Chloroflexi bacterium]|nr:sulfotransferase [Chloroflexota bacterium]
MSDHLRDHPVFLCGYPRSGTSLVRALLDGHPQLVVYPFETFFFRGFLPQAARRDMDGKVELASRYLLQFVGLRHEMEEDYEHFHPNEDTVHDFAKMCLSIQRQIAAHGCRHDGDLLAASVLAFGEVYGFLHENTRCWLEKSVHNEFFAEQIFGWWPEARCIHLMRDPRDVYSSYHPRRQKVLPRLFSLRWARSAQKGLDNQRVYGEDHYYLIEYEQLAQDPEAALQGLTHFLGIEDHPILRIPSSMGIPWEGNSTFADKFAGISARPVERWRKELARHDVQIIEQIARQPMTKLGYRVENKWSLSTSLRILRGFLSYYRDAIEKIDPADIDGVE